MNQKEKRISKQNEGREVHVAGVSANSVSHEALEKLEKLLMGQDLSLEVIDYNRVLLNSSAPINPTCDDVMTSFNMRRLVHYHALCRFIIRAYVSGLASNAIHELLEFYTVFINMYVYASYSTVYVFDDAYLDAVINIDDIILAYEACLYNQSLSEKSFVGEQLLSLKSLCVLLNHLLENDFTEDLFTGCFKNMVEPAYFSEFLYHMNVGVDHVFSKRRLKPN